MATANCQFDGCPNPTAPYSGKGRQPKYCPAHQNDASYQKASRRARARNLPFGVCAPGGHLLAGDPEGMVAGEVGRCRRCGAYCLRPRLRRTKRKLRGRSPNVDLSWKSDAGPSNMRSSSGRLLINHAGGPSEADIRTLTGGERAIPRRGSAWNVLQHISLIEDSIADRNGRKPRSYGDPNRVWLDPPEGLRQWRERGSVIPLSEIRTSDELAPDDAGFDEVEKAA